MSDCIRSKPTPHPTLAWGPEFTDVGASSGAQTPGSLLWALRLAGSVSVRGEGGTA